MNSTTSISQNNSPYTIQSTISRGNSISFLVDKKFFDNCLLYQKNNIKKETDISSKKH